MTEFKMGDKVRVAVDAKYRDWSGLHLDVAKDIAGTVQEITAVPGRTETNYGVASEQWLVLPEYLTLHSDESDMVNHPAHYSAGMPEGIEVIDIIRSQGWEDNYNLGNATKYLLRCEHKGTKKQDLEKLLVYVQWELNRL